ncbi:MAG: aminoacyl-tRNA hydrolase [Thermoanaerobaculia bacterium]
MEPVSEDTPALIVGLGNPGDRYRSARHNLGYLVLDELARRWRIGERRLECNALVSESERAVLSWPQTFMNRSGYAVRCLVERHGFSPERTLVVYDDVALPLGRLRLRGSGGPGGHRGMESVIRNLHTDEIPRLRLGILPERDLDDDALSDFVLAPFEPDEAETAGSLAGRAADACESWLDVGLDITMNRFNG